MTKENRRLAWASLIVLSVLVLFAVRDAQADPLTLRWINPPGSTVSSDTLRVHLGDHDPIDVPSVCAPGEVCEVVVDAPIGNHWTRVESMAGGVIAGPSAPPECRATETYRYDRNGDDDVSTIDFGAFLRAYRLR